MLTDKLTQLQTAFTNLKEKILTKLTTQQETIADKENTLQTVNRQLEKHIKTNSDNESILDKLLTDFQELQKTLE